MGHRVSSRTSNPSTFNCFRLSVNELCEFGCAGDMQNRGDMRLRIQVLTSDTDLEWEELFDEKDFASLLRKYNAIGFKGTDGGVPFYNAKGLHDGKQYQPVHVSFPTQHSICERETCAEPDDLYMHLLAI